MTEIQAGELVNRVLDIAWIGWIALVIYALDTIYWIADNENEKD